MGVWVPLPFLRLVELKTPPQIPNQPKMYVHICLDGVPGSETQVMPMAKIHGLRNYDPSLIRKESHILEQH